MFYHNFKYALKTLLKSKMLIFWTFAFPIILGTFFSMAFSNIEASEQLDIINIAVVGEDKFEYNSVYIETFQSLSDKNSKERLFNTKCVVEGEAKSLLAEDKIVGYVLIGKTPKVVVATSGINETILKSVTEEITQSIDIMQTEVKTKLADNTFSEPQEELVSKIYQNVLVSMNQYQANIKDISSPNLSYTMIEFYTLLAMACLYGGILGMVAMNQSLANMSSTGKRVSVAPTSKGKIVFSSVLASYFVQVIGIVLLFVYTIFILYVDYGTHLFLVFLLTLVGCLAGLSLGVMIASVFKTNENTKLGVLLSFTMLGCFLSGMMGITMKYIIDKNIPLLNKINPASMITDGFYSLYYYDTFDRFYFNLISLLIFALLMIGISMVSLRRQKYDSI